MGKPEWEWVKGKRVKGKESALWVQRCAGPAARHVSQVCFGVLFRPILIRVVARIVEKAGDKVLISVRDNGPGIPQKIIDKIFQPFFTTKPTGQGTGLGLSACYGIIQEHKGKIMCQNGPQGGAIFRIELPAVLKESTWADAPSESTDAEVQAGVTLTLPPTP